jgi:hypothetical protein
MLKLIWEELCIVDMRVRFAWRIAALTFEGLFESKTVCLKNVESFWRFLKFEVWDYNVSLSFKWARLLQFIVICCQVLTDSTRTQWSNWDTLTDYYFVFVSRPIFPMKPSSSFVFFITSPSIDSISILHLLFFRSRQLQSFSNSFGKSPFSLWNVSMKLSIFPFVHWKLIEIEMILSISSIFSLHLHFSPIFLSRGKFQKLPEKRIKFKANTTLKFCLINCLQLNILFDR